ncbi:MAG: PIN domain-containing protein [Candidatus Woesearchaeota archaeon]
MRKKYYLDTSIWIDFFENRNEPNNPKEDNAERLINHIIKKDHKLIISDMIIEELHIIGYPFSEIKELFDPFKKIIIYIESNSKQIGKSKDLSLKRDIPKGDTIHALIARDNQSILITLDKHFTDISDIIKPKRPQDIL